MTDHDWLDFNDVADSWVGGQENCNELMEEIDQLRHDAAILYQVLGVLLWDTERFYTDEGQAILDLASHMAGNCERKDSADTIIPFDSTWPEKLHDGSASQD